MVNFFFFFFFSLSFFELSPALSIFYDFNLNVKDLFIYMFLTGIIFNIFILNKNIKNNLNIDLLLKYFFLFFKVPNIFLNFTINILKKIYLYLIHIKYKKIYYTLQLILKKYFTSLFIL